MKRLLLMVTILMAMLAGSLGLQRLGITHPGIAFASSCSLSPCAVTYTESFAGGYVTVKANAFWSNYQMDSASFAGTNGYSCYPYGCTRDAYGTFYDGSTNAMVFYANWSLCLNSGCSLKGHYYPRIEFFAGATGGPAVYTGYNG